MLSSNETAPPLPGVVETWRLSADTSLFLIEILADGSWRPAYIAPKRLGGWTMEVLPDMPPTTDIEGAVRAWARQYGANVSIRRMPVIRLSTSIHKRRAEAQHDAAAPLSDADRR
uniref:hypothetical protein n=1 Tax=Burkholderia arboris TaxID=488730 RepID=UPI003BEEF4C9